MARIAYYRCSNSDSSIEAQRQALGGGFDKEFVDHGVSGAIPAANRPGFSELLTYVRDQDSVHVYAVDRLGRDALDVQSTVRALMKKGVTVEVLGLGAIAGGVGELILAVLAQVADLERSRIKERCDSGRRAAVASLKAHGVTHRGKLSMGRPRVKVASEIANWRQENAASIAATANHFGVSEATVKRYCALSA